MNPQSMFEHKIRKYQNFSGNFTAREISVYCMGVFLNSMKRKSVMY